MFLFTGIDIYTKEADTPAAPARHRPGGERRVAAACGVEAGSQAALDEGLRFGRGPPVHSLGG